MSLSSYIPTYRFGGLNIKASIAELVAMTLFVFTGCGTAATMSLVLVDDTGLQLPSVKADLTLEERLSVMAASINTNGSWAITTALAFGMAICALVFACAHTSGGQINPAVTLSLVLTGNLPIVQGLCNTIAQFTGGILAGAFLRAFIPHGDSSTLATNQLAPGVGQGSALLGEIMMTMILVLVVLETVCNPRSSVQMLAPLAIGLAVFISHAVLLPIDGCCINPARWFGPAVVSGKAWDTTSWIFIVGPYLGACIGSVIHLLSANEIGDPENFEKQKKVIQVANPIPIDEDAEFESARRHEADGKGNDSPSAPAV